MKKIKYFNDNEILSHDVKWNIVNSSRGIGKSYNRKRKLIKRYCQFGERFVCIYRNGGDKDLALSNWLKSLISPQYGDKRKPYPAHRFTIKNQQYMSLLYVNPDPEPAGIFLAIQNVNKIKQMIFSPYIKWIWVDEYIPIAWTKLNGVADEGDALQNIVDTIDHNTQLPKGQLGYPEIRVIMYGNLTNNYSPLITYFHVDPFRYGTYKSKQDVIIQTKKPPMVKSGPGLKDARVCQLATDRNSFIMAVPKDAMPIKSVRFDNHYYTFYSHKKNKNGYFIKMTNGHKANTKYGTLKGRQDDEFPVDRMIPHNQQWRLRNEANECVDYYNDVFTKMEYLKDVSNIQ